MCMVSISFLVGIPAITMCTLPRVITTRCSIWLLQRPTHLPHFVIPTQQISITWKNNPYNATFDNAIVGVAVKNGPAFSTNTTILILQRVTLFLISRTCLLKDIIWGPLADMDNHNSATMGKANQGRTVVLATARTKAAILDGILNMRFYATEDFNFQIAFNANGNLPMGSIVVQTVNPTFTITSSDPDGETTTQIRLWYGVPSNLTPTVLASIQIPVHSHLLTHSEQEHIITTRKSLRRTEMLHGHLRSGIPKLLLLSR